MSEEVPHLVNCPCGFQAGSSTSATLTENAQRNPPNESPLHPLSASSDSHKISWQEQIFRLQFDSTIDDASAMQILSHLKPFIPRSLPLYLAYYAFRTRGYTLHEGLRLGVDYVVYPIGGANHWHAQFSVLVGDVETVNPHSPSSSPDICSTQASSQHILRTLHIGNKQKKTVLFARVFCTEVSATDTPPESTDSTICSSASSSNPFSSYSVSIIHLSNWCPSRGRQWSNKQDGTQSSQKLLQQQISQPSKKQKLQHQRQQSSSSIPQDFSDEL